MKFFGRTVIPCPSPVFRGCRRGREGGSAIFDLVFWVRLQNGPDETQTFMRTDKNTHIQKRADRTVQICIHRKKCFWVLEEEEQSTYDFTMTRVISLIRTLNPTLVEIHPSCVPETKGCGCVYLNINHGLRKTPTTAEKMGKYDNNNNNMISVERWIGIS